MRLHGHACAVSERGGRGRRPPRARGARPAMSVLVNYDQLLLHPCWGQRYQWE